MGILLAINTLITRINLITSNIRNIQTYLGVNTTGSTSSISERLAYVEGSCCSSSSTVSLLNNQLIDRVGAYSGEIIFITDLDTHVYWSTDNVWRNLATREVAPLSGRGIGLAGTYYEGFEEASTIDALWESDLFGNLEEGSEEGKWNRMSNTTPTKNTGPDKASVGEYYLYAETSGGGNNEVFTLSTSNFSYITSLSMDINMYGRNIGTFEVVTYSDLEPTVRYSISGDQGSDWIPITLDLEDLSIERVVLRYSGATGSRGDLAIDNIRMESV